jgi:hypothetical protein
MPPICHLLAGWHGRAQVRESVGNHVTRLEKKQEVPSSSARENCIAAVYAFQQLLLGK